MDRRTDGPNCNETKTAFAARAEYKDLVKRDGGLFF